MNILKINIYISVTATNEETEKLKRYIGSDALHLLYFPFLHVCLFQSQAS